MKTHRMPLDRMALAAAFTCSVTACGPTDLDPHAAGASTADAPIAERQDTLYVASDKIWASTRIPVCWEVDGRSVEKGWVRGAIAATWEAETAVEFTGWQRCTDDSRGIRINVAEVGPHVTALGRRLDGRRNGMVLNFGFSSWSPSCQNNRRDCIEDIAVHEFGHALGFAHEHNRDDTPDSCQDAPQGSDGDIVLGAWDLHSVMNYCNPVWNGDGQLSATDIAGARVYYGGGAFEGTADRWHTDFAHGTATPLAGDFDGDGRDDIVSFTGGNAGDVHVALNRGGSFGQRGLWHGWFAPYAEVPLVGDFDGDGRDDIVTFTQGAAGDVYVALSDGRSFSRTSRWHDWFAPHDEVPVVGDFDGDGRDDIATFTRGASADVFVALSNGRAFVGTASRWHSNFAPGTATPKAGDVNGDGLDDIVYFTHGSSGDVYVALSDGRRFGGVQRWHDWFAPYAELPEVTDVNGDGLADIVTFTRGGGANVYVALSDGTRFTAGRFHHDWFAPYDEIPTVGDFDGDGRGDIVTFTRGASADVYVATYR